MGLGERLTHYPGSFSGANERVAIARALAPSPKLLIAESRRQPRRGDRRQIADLLFAEQRERA